MHPRLIAEALGALLAVIGLCMATAIPWSIYYQDGVYDELILVAILCVTVGLVTFMVSRDHEADFGTRDGFIIVTAGWILAGLFGALPFWGNRRPTQFRGCRF